MPIHELPGKNQALLYFTDVLPEVALAIYFVVGVILTVQTIRSRAQAWVYILVGTAFAESLGYVFRTICVRRTTFGMYILMTLFLLLPPNTLALVNYKTVSKVISDSSAQPRQFWLKPKFVTWFFFLSDVFSILMQGTGGGMLTKKDYQSAGKAIVLLGLTVQLFFFACFLTIAAYVWRQPVYAITPGPKDRSPESAKNTVMRTIVATTVIIYLRNIYRVAEFADGYGGKIYRAEWAFYVFDTLLILIAFVFYVVFFIGNNFRRKSAAELTQILSQEK
ncbi:RTA1 like protein [Martensiomyces pterosporus]|nr:RTA1 like protein [Martensiomyces pterosporus]